MKYKPFMKVGFIYGNDNKSKKIAGGVYNEYSTEDLSWLDFVKKNILIETRCGALNFKVEKVNLSTSIAGFLNIVLILEENPQIDLINIGDEVLKYIEE